RVLSGHLPEERAETLEGRKTVDAQKIVTHLREQVGELAERHRMPWLGQLAPQAAEQGEAIGRQGGFAHLVAEGLQPLRRDLDPRRALRRRQLGPRKV